MPSRNNYSRRPPVTKSRAKSYVQGNGFIKESRETLRAMLENGAEINDIIAYAAGRMITSYHSGYDHGLAIGKADRPRRKRGFLELLFGRRRHDRRSYQRYNRR